MRGEKPKGTSGAQPALFEEEFDFDKENFDARKRFRPAQRAAISVA